MGSVARAEGARLREFPPVRAWRVWHIDEPGSVYIHRADCARQAMDDYTRELYPLGCGKVYEMEAYRKGLRARVVRP